MSEEGETKLGAEFVNGWVIAHVLGEGAFGEVRLLVHEDTGRAVAMKSIDMTKDLSGATKREIITLKMLRHENVIQYLGQRIHGKIQYIFLEYASGGELFDKIEPDVGMPEVKAHNYFRQLIAGVDYMHQVGVTHRDLKPENLLLTENDVLKITDFGLATVFRFKGEERKMAKRCGTLPYIAPEVLQCDKFDAPPADVWSCGITLVTMLVGVLPWDSPTPSCQDFADWKECRSWRRQPWSKIPNVALSLLRAILRCQPENRATISSIKSHQWFVKDFSKRLTSRFHTPPTKRLRFEQQSEVTTCASQPEPSAAGNGAVAAALSCKLQTATSVRLPFEEDAAAAAALRLLLANDKKKQNNGSANKANVVFSFSQPEVLGNLLIPTQSQPSQSQQNLLQKLVRRMTRFGVKKLCADALAEVELVCGGILKYASKRTTPSQLTISTIDRRRAPLVFKATAYEMNGNTLLDFRLSKGDGLEFKRKFMAIRELMAESIDKELANSWTSAVAV